MSWKHPYNQALNLVCKVSPNGRTCENYLRKEHPECFPNPSIFEVILELPMKAFKFLFSSQQMPCEHNSNAFQQKRAHHHHHCPHHSSCGGMDYQDDDYSVLSGFFRSLVILAISIGILYAIFKAVAQRRGSTQ